ncbi:MAG: excinuclease ABC subunit A [Paracoccaceae bacterium]
MSPKRFVLTAAGTAALLLTLSAQGALADKGHCPPGLAKKAVPCVPPGLAKKGVRHWDRGDYVGDEDYHRIRYPDRYGLPPLAPGQRYLIVGNRIMVVDEATYTVVTVLNAIDAILD